jgi:4-hydroxythreonine-4-phosphate dehydrogenase
VNPIPRLLLTAGEPAGIGPELLVAIAARPWDAELVAVADPALLTQRAAVLGLSLQTPGADLSAPPRPHRVNVLPVLPVPLAVPAQAGALDARNSGAALEAVATAVRECMAGRAQALVTAPLHKGVINDAGIPFTGHTEYLAQLTGAPQPVMLLVAGTLRVALATTHLPLRAVAEAITAARLGSILRVLDTDLRSRFGIRTPRILVTGLNPHAGEGGHLGSEETEIIAPLLQRLRTQGLTLQGPLPADTAFTPRLLEGADAVLTMYHDQGLPVLKHVGFGRAVNVTLGLPIVRTSVDHGTALELAGSGGADPGSLIEAVQLAIALALRSAGSNP